MAKKKSSSSALPGVFALMTLLLGVLGVVLMYTLELIGFGLQLGDKKSDAAMIVGKDVMFGSKSQYGDLDLLKPTPMAIVSWVLLLAGAALALVALICLLLKVRKLSKLMMLLGGLVLIVGGAMVFAIGPNFSSVNLVDTGEFDLFYTTLGVGGWLGGIFGIVGGLLGLGGAIVK